MNWVVVGITAEIIGAVAVVVSLLYVAVQIRENTKVSQDEAYRDIFGVISTQCNVMADPSNAALIRKGLMQFAELDGEEKIRFDNLLCAVMTVVESSIISHGADLMLDETLETWANFLGPRYLAYPGMVEWWSGTKGIFAPAAQVWVDEQIRLSESGMD